MTDPLPAFVDATDLADFRAGDPATVVGQAQARVRSYCQWHVAPEITETVTLDGRGSKFLALPSLRVAEITSVTEEGTLLTTDDYDWSASGYIERRNGYWTERPRQIVVVFKHGFVDVPDDLIGVAAAWAARAATSPSGVRREAAGGVSRDYGDSDLFADEKAILDRYRLPPRP
jgi:hypothetical protein